MHLRIRFASQGLAFVLCALLLAGGPAHAVGLTGDRRATIFIKGGAGRIVTGTLQSETEWGPVFGAGLMIQPADFFGMDFTYEGGRFELTGPVTDETGEHAALWRHGGELLLKFGGPITPVVYPYVGAGVGASWMVPTGPFTSGIPTDLVLTVPVAAGIDLRSQGFLAGIRFTYRFLIDEWFARTATERVDSGGALDVQLILGLRF